MKFYGIRIEYKDNKSYPVIMLFEDNKKYEYFSNVHKLKEVGGFISPTFKPISMPNIDKESLLNKETNAYFSFDKSFYDTQFEEMSINSPYFLKANLRQKEKQPLWIFKGDSMLGKSYISSFLYEYKSIYETDKSITLPDELNYDIIVVGNKYSFTNEEILERIPENREVIYASFSKEK